MKRILCLFMLLVFLNQVLMVNLYAQAEVTARVTQVSINKITIDQGSASGLKAGSKGVVYYSKLVGGQEVLVAVALVRVESVSDSTSELVILDSTAPVAKDYSVDISLKKGSKWWIWVLVAVAVGGGAAAAGGGGGGGGSTPTPATTTGTISIDLPAN